MPKHASEDELFDLYWLKGKSRIVVGHLLSLTQTDLINDFAEYKIPMRYEAVLYEHEFSKLFNKKYTADGTTNSSKKFYCSAFRALGLNTKISLIGTLSLAYLQIKINLYNFNQDKSYLVKTGTLGFAALSGAAMPIQQSVITSIITTYMDIEMLAGDPDSEMDSNNYFLVEECLGFFG